MPPKDQPNETQTAEDDETPPAEGVEKGAPEAEAETEPLDPARDQEPTRTRTRDQSEAEDIVELSELFDEHCSSLSRLAIARRGRLGLQIVTRQVAAAISDNTGECVTHARLPTDRFMGDARLRSVYGLLREIDGRGYERSNHQARFHDAFIRACSRVLYREEWAVHRDAIRELNKWDETPSEIMISTPRRFGKTFRYERLEPHAHSLLVLSYAQARYE